jgi:NitT/TauT family transport system ATP-binding protein
MIEIKNLTVKYKSAQGENTALDNLNINIDSGDICAVIGPSVCGKTTLLHVLCGIIKNYSGSIAVNGESVNSKLQRIGMVQQNYGLLRWKNVFNNSILGAVIKDGKAGLDKAYTDYILNELGLMEFKYRFPNQLSGGQRQRVAIARSFILKPNMLLMDEPFSALDAITREETQDLFLKIWKKNRVSTLFITHSIDEALYIGRKIVILSPSPGRVIHVIDNPLFGRENIRMMDEFYDLEKEIRKIIKEGWYK